MALFACQRETRNGAILTTHGEDCVHVISPCSVTDLINILLALFLGLCCKDTGPFFLPIYDSHALCLAINQREKTLGLYWLHILALHKGFYF